MKVPRAASKTQCSQMNNEYLKTTATNMSLGPACHLQPHLISGFLLSLTSPSLLYLFQTSFCPHHSQSSSSQPGALLSPRRLLVTSGNTFACHCSGRGATGSQQVGARAAAGHSAVHRPAPCTQNSVAIGANRAAAGKP